MSAAIVWVHGGNRLASELEIQLFGDPRRGFMGALPSAAYLALTRDLRDVRLGFGTGLKRGIGFTAEQTLSYMRGLAASRSLARFPALEELLVYPGVLEKLETMLMDAFIDTSSTCINSEVAQMLRFAEQEKSTLVLGVAIGDNASHYAAAVSLAQSCGRVRGDIVYASCRVG